MGQDKVRIHICPSCEHPFTTVRTHAGFIARLRCNAGGGKPHQHRTCNSCKHEWLVLIETI